MTLGEWMAELRAAAERGPRTDAQPDSVERLKAMTLPAGSHGFPLSVVHADMTPAELRAHLHADHGGAPHPRLGAAAAQQAHRMKHEFETEGDGR